MGITELPPESAEVLQRETEAWEKWLKKENQRNASKKPERRIPGSHQKLQAIKRVTEDLQGNHISIVNYTGNLIESPHNNGEWR